MNGHHTMLSDVLELARSLDRIIPYGNHTMFQRLWKSEIENAFQTIEQTEDEKDVLSNTLDILSDALEIFTREAENTSWKTMTVDERVEKVNELKSLPQIPQRSQEWFENYGKVLTASEFSALFAMNKRRRDLVYSKSHPSQESQNNYRHACPTDEMNAIGWGIRFEPVIKQILETKDKCTVFEPGRIQHPTNTHLAASPDGIIEKANNPQQLARLIEIKCPYSRVIGKEIPSDYWIQMQIQMEVTDVDECEYIEANLISKRANQSEPLDLSEATYTGTVYLLKQIVEEGEPFDYKYVYGDIGLSEVPLFPDGYECVETIPWGLRSWYRKVIQRDRHWYEGTLPWQEAFWRDVEAAKEGTLAPLAPAKPIACLITDD
jgi:putative phage-type endonuclease